MPSGFSTIPELFATAEASDVGFASANCDSVFAIPQGATIISVVLGTGVAANTTITIAVQLTAVGVAIGVAQPVFGGSGQIPLGITPAAWGVTSDQLYQNRGVLGLAALANNPTGVPEDFDLFDNELTITWEVGGVVRESRAALRLRPQRV